MQMLRNVSGALLVFILFPLTLWTVGAIWFDGPLPGPGNGLLALFWLVLLAFAVTRSTQLRMRFVGWLAMFLAVLIPWLLKKPSNDRNWEVDFANVPGVTIEGDLVTFTNFRNFDYQPDGTPIEKWETKQFHLSKLKHMDFFMTYWDGQSLVGHPIFSFDFGDEGHVAFSIESRREKGETYDILTSLYKQYELIYVVGSESDLIRSRTNFRKGENVFLYRLNIKETTTRMRFAEYLDSIDHFQSRPAWYNAVTANCTTAVRGQITTDERHSLDWRILVNGRLVNAFNELGILDKSLPFAELKQRSHINPAALANPDPATFSETIRKGLPGFE
jgi:hypothetical protein